MQIALDQNQTTKKPYNIVYSTIYRLLQNSKYYVFVIVYIQNNMKWR